MQLRSITLAAGAAGLFVSPAAAQQVQWQQMPRMQLERQFAGPLQDTIIQRWRDPADGLICVIYLPITAQHTPPATSGYVQYGANTIGSISCTAAPSVTVAKTASVPATESMAARTMASLRATALPPATAAVPYISSATVKR
jgi:hypothetical protein